ncbi:hypothetical protein G6F37_006929 [Rhizopus arrhizus]|nr:hypothetical protein G6F37_006929 [Rhizopus arrhizus]
MRPPSEWAFKGKPAVAETPTGRAVSHTVLGAITAKFVVSKKNDKEKFDASHKLITIPENSYVMVKVNIKTNKLDPNYEGPYKHINKLMESFNPASSKSTLATNSASSIPSSSAVNNITVKGNYYNAGRDITINETAERDIKKQKTNHNDKKEIEEVDFKQKWIEFLADAEQNKNFHRYSPEKNGVTHLGAKLSPHPHANKDTYRKMKMQLKQHEASGTWIDVKGYIRSLVAASDIDEFEQNIEDKALVEGQEKTCRSVLAMMKKNEHAPYFVPGEDELEAMTAQLKKMGQRTDKRKIYKADGIIRLERYMNLEVLILETAGAFGHEDYTKTAFDNSKGMFALLSMLKTIADQYKHASVEEFSKLKLYFVQPSGYHIRLWSMQYAKNGLYDFVREEKILLSEDFSTREEQLVSLSRLEEIASTIAALKGQHEENEKNYDSGNYSQSKKPFQSLLQTCFLSEAEQTKQFACFPLRTTFVSCDMTLNSKIIHYHVLKSKKNPNTGSKLETWGAVVDLNKKVFKHQGFQKSLRFQGTLETDGVGVSIIKQNTHTSRKPPKPNIEKKVDGNQTEHIEGLGRVNLKSIEGKCVLIDPGRRDLMYCMKETSTVEEKQTLIFTKNNHSKCSRHFRYLRKHSKKFVQYIKTRASVKNILYEYYGNKTTKSKETYLSESEFDFRVDQKCNLYYGNLFIARIRGFFPQPENYSTDSSVKSQLYATYLQTMLQQKHISERLDDSEKSKVLGLAKEEYRQPQQSNYKKTISKALEKLQLLPFRKLKFSSKLFLDQNDQKLVRSLKAKFGQDAVLVFGDWSAPNVKYQEPTRSKGLIRMLKKNGFVVYLINKYKISSHLSNA